MADQYGINVALRALDGGGKWVGIEADAATPAGTLRRLKDRPFTVRVAAGAPGLPRFFLELYRLELKPAMIALECAPE